jgi:hypothetical protein
VNNIEKLVKTQLILENGSRQMKLELKNREIEKLKRSLQLNLEGVNDAEYQRDPMN